MPAASMHLEPGPNLPKDAVRLAKAELPKCIGFCSQLRQPRWRSHYHSSTARANHWDSLLVGRQGRNTQTLSATRLCKSHRGTWSVEGEGMPNFARLSQRQCCIPGVTVACAAPSTCESNELRAEKPGSHVGRNRPVSPQRLGPGRQRGGLCKLPDENPASSFSYPGDNPVA